MTSSSNSTTSSLCFFISPLFSSLMHSVAVIYILHLILKTKKKNKKKERVHSNLWTLEMFSPYLQRVLVLKRASAVRTIEK